MQLEMPSITVVSATSEAAGATIAGTNAMAGMGMKPLSGLPAFCRVIGRLQPTPASDIGFEVWLPSAGWDGRLHGVGVGGFGGFIDHGTLALALKAGQAAVATDTGHIGESRFGPMFDSRWAQGHPERIQDYSTRAIHASAIAAKQIIRAFYGRGPERSYFVGCSGGGRQGLVEASRYPEDYDGVLAGAPAATFTDMALNMINSVQAQSGDAALRPEQLPLIRDEVLQQCDALDGQSDGLIDDPRQCRLDESTLQCGTSRSPQCLSPAQTGALSRILSGPHDSTGRQLAPGFMPAGSEPGWNGFLVKGPYGGPGNAMLTGGLLQDFIPQPFATPDTFDFDRDSERLKAALSDTLDASPNLRRYFARGGKLIIWHGWADQAIAPEISIHYYDAMRRQSGVRAASSARLFMVPGVEHCTGGSGAAEFGQTGAPQPGETPETSIVAALQAWVEHRRQPDSLVGSRLAGGTRSQRQRLLCAWPRKAVLQAGADPDQAASYRCTDRMP
jgi:feruloyl esterase